MKILQQDHQFQEVFIYERHTYQGLGGWMTTRRPRLRRRGEHTIQIFIIVSVILVALVLYLFVSPVVNIDIFDMIPVLIFLFFSPIICVFCIVIGGIFRSKVFR